MKNARLINSWRTRVHKLYGSLLCLEPATYWLRPKKQNKTQLWSPPERSERIGPVLLPCHDQDGLDGPHAEVVVVLLGQLLRAQLVHLGHLPGERLAGLESL